MGLLDQALGSMGGGMDIGALAGKVGLTEEQVRSGIAALAPATAEHGDTVQLAATRTGLPLDKLQSLLAAIGGEGGAGLAGGLSGGLAGGLAGNLGGMFGR